MTFNRKKCMERMMGDQELFEEMVDVFFQETPDKLIVMEDDLTQERWVDLASNAHYLKGSFTALQMEAGQRIAKSLEFSAREHDGNQSREYLEQLKTQVELFRKCVEK